MEWFVFNYFTPDRGISVLLHAFAFLVVILALAQFFVLVRRRK